MLTLHSTSELALPDSCWTVTHHHSQFWNAGQIRLDWLPKHVRQIVLLSPEPELCWSRSKIHLQHSNCAHACIPYNHCLAGYLCSNSNRSNNDPAVRHWDLVSRCNHKKKSVQTARKFGVPAQQWPFWDYHWDQAVVAVTSNSSGISATLTIKRWNWKGKLHRTVKAWCVDDRQQHALIVCWFCRIVGGISKQIW